MGEETAIANPDKKQHKTAQAKEQAIARLENHRFKPGQSGNPKGRPKKAKELLPVTKMVRAIQDDEVPMVIRLKLEKAYKYQVEETGPDGKPIMLDGNPVMKWMEGEPLPEHLTYAEANARGMMLSIWGLAPGFNSVIAENVAVRVEGLPTKKVEIVQNEETDLTNDPDSLKRIIYGKFTEMAIERAREFNIALPGIQDLADEIGVGNELGIPREDQHTAGS
jgi:hypothetical protein